MMHVYYCPCCDRFFYIQYEVHTECRGCDTPMYKVNLAFTQFYPLSYEERYENFVDDYFESDYYQNLYEESRRREDIVKRKIRRMDHIRKKGERLFKEEKYKYN